MKYTIDLPQFPGFYDSFLFSSEAETEALQLIAENLYPYTFPPAVLMTYFNTAPDAVNYTLDFSGYCEAVARAYCSVIEDALSDALYRKQPVFTGTSIWFAEIVSPREYNFTTDRVECAVEVDEGDLLIYLSRNLAAWNKYLEDRFTSRDGFLSFYEPTDPGFMDPDAWTEDPVYLSAVLDFIVLNDLGPDAMFFCSERALSRVSLVDYIKLPPALELFLNGEDVSNPPPCASMIEEYNRLSQQGSRYLEIMGDQYRPAVNKGMDRITRELAAEMIETVQKLGA